MLQGMCAKGWLTPWTTDSTDTIRQTDRQSDSDTADGGPFNFNPTVNFYQHQTQTEVPQLFRLRILVALCDVTTADAARARKSSRTSSRSCRATTPCLVSRWLTVNPRINSVCVRVRSQRALAKLPLEGMLLWLTDWLLVTLKSDWWDGIVVAFGIATQNHVWRDATAGATQGRYIFHSIFQLMFWPHQRVSQKILLEQE